MLTKSSCITFLDHPLIAILEFRNTAPSAGLSNKSLWILVDKKASAVTILTLGYTDSAADISECFFEQGYLKYNLKEGTFIEKFNLGQHSLDRLDPSLLPESIFDADKFQIPEPLAC